VAAPLHPPLQQLQNPQAGPLQVMRPLLLMGLLQLQEASLDQVTQALLPPPLPPQRLPRSTEATVCSSSTLAS
jgi:hypothetical protein